MNLFSDVINGMLLVSRPSVYWKTSSDKYFPELIAAKTIKQRNDQSVFNHTMDVLDALQFKNDFTLLAALFHDLGKTKIPAVANPSHSKFPNHASISANIAHQRLQLWQSPFEIIDQVCRLIKTHMFDITLPLSNRTISKFVADVGCNNINDWFTLRIADSAAYQYHRAYCQHLIDPFRTRVNEYLNQLPGTAPFANGEIDIDTGMQIDGK